MLASDLGCSHVARRQHIRRDAWDGQWHLHCTGRDDFWLGASTWLAAGILIPFASFGGLAGRPLGDRLGADAFAMLAIALLAVAGAYPLGVAALAFATA